MATTSASRRSRGPRGAEQAARVPVHVALERCSQPERTLLALMLVERLSPAEAALAMGLPLRRLERSYRTLLVELRRTVDVSGLDLGRMRRAA